MKHIYAEAVQRVAAPKEAAHCLSHAFIRDRREVIGANPILHYEIGRDENQRLIARVSFNDGDLVRHSYEMSDAALQNTLRHPGLDKNDYKTLTMALHYLRMQTAPPASPAAARR